MSYLLRVVRIREWSIRSYFALLTVMFVAASASAVAYVEIQTNRDARVTATKDAKFAATTAAKQLGDYLTLVQATTKQVATNPRITETFIHPTGCSLTFTGVSGADASHIDVIRPDGTVACSSTPATPDTVSRASRAHGYHGDSWVTSGLCPGRW